MDEILEKIKQKIDIKQYHLLRNYKIIASGKNISELEKNLENFEPPKKELKVFIIRITINKNYKYPLVIQCSQETLDEDLVPFFKDDDLSQSFTYSNNELIKYGFRLNHINKMIKAIKNKSISFRKTSISISDIID